jgi:hypothetical protein
MFMCWVSLFCNGFTLRPTAQATLVCTMLQIGVLGQESTDTVLVHACKPLLIAVLPIYLIQMIFVWVQVILGRISNSAVEVFIRSWLGSWGWWRCLLWKIQRTKSSKEGNISLFMTRERAHVQGEIGENIDALLKSCLNFVIRNHCTEIISTTCCWMDSNHRSSKFFQSILGCSVFNDSGREESSLPLLDDAAICNSEDFLVFYIMKEFRT